jgi:hypothetical protein
MQKKNKFTTLINAEKSLLGLGEKMTESLTTMQLFFKTTKELLESLEVVKCKKQQR